MSIDTSRIELISRVDALGVNPNPEQLDNLVAWTVANIPRASWAWAAGVGMNVEGFFTAMSERMGETPLSIPSPEPACGPFGDDRDITYQDDDERADRQ